MTMYSLNKISGYIKDAKCSELLSGVDVITALISDSDNYTAVELGLFNSEDEAIKKMKTFTPLTLEINSDYIFVSGYFIQENEYDLIDKNYILCYYGDIHSFNVSAVQKRRSASL